MTFKAQYRTILICTLVILGQNITVRGQHFQQNMALLGTGSKVKGQFHQVLDEGFQQTQQFNLPVPGSVLAFEKINRRKIDLATSQKTPWNEILELYDLEYHKVLKKNSLKGSIRSINHFLSGSKSILLTHVVDYDGYQKKLCYSIYDSVLTGINLLENNLIFYAKFRQKLQHILASGNYTHLIIACTGWKNDQRDSFNHYREWISSFQSEMPNYGEFKPYFIGITWPSNGTKANFIDYFNKVNDADELGILQVNQLLWEVIMPALLQLKKPPVTMLIGHSMGARILSRALYSRKFKMNKRPGLNEKFDYFICLQGAFDIKRYLALKGGERGIYTLDVPVKYTLATCSMYDGANPIAFWSCHVGSRKTVRKLYGRKQYYYRKFNEVLADADGNIIGDFGDKRFKLIIADEFIRSCNGDISGAHGDVFDRQTARFVGQAMEKFKSMPK